MATLMSKRAFQSPVCLDISAKEVMFLPGFVCEFVCVFVCEQDNSKTYRRILMKFSGYV